MNRLIEQLNRKNPYKCFDDANVMYIIQKIKSTTIIDEQDIINFVNKNIIPGIEYDDWLNINCTKCEDCIMCINCHNSKRCTLCNNCHTCKSCMKSNNLIGCKRCYNCKECEYCFDQIN